MPHCVCVHVWLVQSNSVTVYMLLDTARTTHECLPKHSLYTTVDKVVNSVLSRVLKPGHVSSPFPADSSCKPSCSGLRLLPEPAQLLNPYLHPNVGCSCTCGSYEGSLVVIIRTRLTRTLIVERRGRSLALCEGLS